MDEKNNLKRFKPFILTFVLVVIDQLTKFWIVKNVPLNTMYGSYLNDFVRIIHVRNQGAAFSFGANASAFVRIVFFVIISSALMVGLGFMIASKKKNILSSSQKWIVAGILGGGIGTMIDRIFRADLGVVDFISINVYGLLGMERWPTFNVSDSCVVCFVIVFLVSEIFEGKKEDKSGKKKK